MITTTPHVLFDECPDMIGEYTRNDYHTEVNFSDPEVLLEFVEYQVVLPIISYRSGTKVFALEFNQTQFIVKSIDIDVYDVKEDILGTYTINQLKDAIHGLVHQVKDAVQ